MSRKQPFQSTISVRFNDIDAMGHVNNAVIFTYFEEGRKALFYDAFRQSVPGGFNFMVAHLECDYILPVRLEDRLLLTMWVTAIGTKSFGLAYALIDATDQNRFFAKGSSVQVCYDYRQRQSVPVPQTLKKALMAYHLPS
ncbi:thioesterase family protein [Desulfosarcina sp.]|uniref:acyl-CoA thioesterase n=1 Tax=Desulfosarcina sp. TaxID=2027861 RepID=UPI0029B2C9CF|nr:thioesterase family protein [Desulfosarcina sp.]MDX2453108.1 thioesterase family protein [Desulfosarcina sp.]MDX2490839.1 thioesterase family protein [Desulfosarcina sp.]